MKRAVRSLIRLIALGLFVFGGMEIILEYVRHRMRDTAISLWHCVIGSALIALGVFVFAISAKLAEQLTDDFEE